MLSIPKFYRWSGPLVLWCGLLIVGLHLTATSLGITEMPTGTVDGHNTTYFLRFLPSNAAPVTLFLNGIPVSNTDYALHDQQITFVREHVPQVGDTLQASYLPVRRKAGFRPSNEDLNPNGPEAKASKNQELSRAAILEALDQEVQQPEPRLIREEPLPETAGAFSDVPEAKSHKSTKLPSSQLRDRSSKNRSKQTVRSARAIDTAGVEGLGDTPPSSSLDPQMNLEEDEAESPSSRSFTSLQLLRRKLSEEKQPKTQKSQENSHSKSQPGASSRKRDDEDSDRNQ